MSTISATVVLYWVVGRTGGGIVQKGQGQIQERTGRDGREVWGTAWKQSLLGTVPGGGHFLSLGTFLSQELGQKLVTG